jgi:hypothetical protein
MPVLGFLQYIGSTMLREWLEYSRRERIILEIGAGDEGYCCSLDVPSFEDGESVLRRTSNGVKEGGMAVPRWLVLAAFPICGLLVLVAASGCGDRGVPGVPPAPTQSPAPTSNTYQPIPSVPPAPSEPPPADTFQPIPGVPPAPPPPPADTFQPIPGVAPQPTSTGTPSTTTPDERTPEPAP